MSFTVMTERPGHHDGAIGQRVRADRRDHQHVEVRRDDGAAAGQRIGGGAGGTRHHQAVAAVGVHVGAVDPGFEIEHAAGFPLLQHDVVERQRAVACAVGADEARLEQRALVALAAPFEGGIDRSEHVLRQHVGEETQAAAIDADQRHAAMRDQARGIEKCAVAADGDDQVGVIGDLVFGNARDQVGGRVERVGLRQ